MLVSSSKLCHVQEQSSSSQLMASHHSDDEEENLRAACNLWYLDSGCSKHMTGDRNKFYVPTPTNKGYVTYGDNKGKILGVGRIGKPPSTTIEGVLYVEGLKHNLQSISQLCDKGFHVAFYPDKCIIKRFSLEREEPRPSESVSISPRILSGNLA
ncbi:hypothetical protein Lal_00032197 [Lupinus albus]|nr:hypothetical protein Lal_00032197 [Lupinus albus]